VAGKSRLPGAMMAMGVTRNLHQPCSLFAVSAILRPW
jgi:hypothetical protein